MDYKLTFEDGSEALMHHGIKGMKWGVWNAETAARYRGGLKNPSKLKANLKYGAKTAGRVAAGVAVGAPLGAAAAIGTGGNPTAAGAAFGAGYGTVWGVTGNLGKTAKNKRLAEIEEAEKRKGKNAISEVLSDSASNIK